MKLRYLTLWMLLAPLLSCYATDYYFRNVNVKDGLVDNFVRDIVRDSQGYMWFSTINGLSRYDGYRLRNYMPKEYGGSSNDVRLVRETADSTLWMFSDGTLFTYDRKKVVWSKNGAQYLEKMGIQGTAKVFYVDDRHNLWVVTDYGIYHFDYGQKALHHIANYINSPILHLVARNGVAVVVTTDFKIFEVALREKRLVRIGQTKEVSYNRDNRVFIDHNMNLWFYNSLSQAGSQWLFSLKTHQWRQAHELRQVGNSSINAISEDNNGNLWVGTGNAGIYVFENQNDQLVLTESKGMSAFVSLSSHITTFYLDDNNTMWVGSAKLGIAYTDVCSPRFNVVSKDEFEDVSALLFDKSGNLWIGYDGGGVSRRAPSGVMTHYSALSNQLPSNIVTSLGQLADGSLLVGTYGCGIAKWDGTRFQPFRPDCADLRYVKAMTIDKHGNLWVATVDRGVVRVGKDGKADLFNSANSALVSNGVLSLACDSLRDMIYIGTSTGVAAYDCAKGSFASIPQLDKLKDSYVSVLLVGHHGILYAGSRDGLWAYYPKADSMQHLTTDQGMSHNVIRALSEVDNGIWASTDNGLTWISMQMGENQVEYRCFPFLDSDGLHNVVFSDNAACSTPSGRVLMGGFSGFVSISPENIIPHYQKLQVRFTDFRVNGEVAVMAADVFTIRHDDHLGVSVSAMVPAMNQKVKYVYRLKGEEDWVRAPGNILYLVSISPGTHVLQVKAVLPGMSESEIAEMTIKVMPPFWRSRPAMAFVLLLLLGILYLVYRNMKSRQKRELDIKQLELNLKKYEMEEEKIRFFTNISHDLKTPLTLVVAPLEKIREANLPGNIRTELDVAWRNARQLYDLILQLLDFRRLDVGKEALHLKHGDIVGFVRQTVQAFTYYAIGKKIEMQLALPAEPIEIDFDENKLQRVITNLLSNAYKYNVDNGKVVFSLAVNGEEQHRQIVISVADTGIGVVDKEHVFDRFVQETHGQEQEGSGLGLHIVRLYVEMMRGQITVADNKPRGSIFTVVLPVMKSEEDDGYTNGASVNEAGKSGLVSTHENTRHQPSILVVEDNTDARLFLQRSLEDEYKVLIAANGKEALDVLAKNEDVSLVVSDVMMPVMDGLQLFRQIKRNINYSHIPVILLTAKSSEENIVEGLEEGAADYITKPFSLAVLRLRIRKILEWTQQTHHNIASGIEIKPSEITVSSLDEELIANVIAKIEDNISDVNYSVAQLSSAVGMTRGHLYKKLMAITGKSPIEFIRIIKMKRGKSLLDQGKTNISEVADMVGFSAKQFSHYFKATYGDTPSDYLKKRKN